MPITFSKRYVPKANKLTANMGIMINIFLRYFCATKQRKKNGSF